MTNGPLFAISRRLASYLDEDLRDPSVERGSWEWLRRLEQGTPLGRRYFWWLHAASAAGTLGNASRPRSTRRVGLQGATEPSILAVPRKPKELLNRAWWAAGFNIERLPPILHSTLYKRAQALNRPHYLVHSWPNSDNVFGFHVARAGLRRRQPVTLVNTPMMSQHYPWPVYSRNAFGNHSIVLHGAKRATSRLWTFAQRRSSGPFIPLSRECDSCSRMGWSTYPGSEFGSWQCCGARVPLAHQDF